jgi:F-type H+-transporting ATPase subunit gamma
VVTIASHGESGVTRRRELEEHLHKLGEIRDIMNSMKTLAYMETRKLNRFLGNQHAMMENIEKMASDFVSYFPETLSIKGETTNIYLLIGSERGFCGNFNETLLPALESILNKNKNNKSLLVTVGHKLRNILEEDKRINAHLNGASVTEEIEAVLTRIVDTLINLQAAYPSISLYVIYHAEEHGESLTSDNSQVLIQKLLPPFQDDLNKKTLIPNKPILNVSPDEFLLELTDHYLLAGLHEILYTSLMAENHRRMQHLEGAVDYMDDKAEELTGKCNALRQEEIIEEIEVILLNSGGPEETLLRK